MRRLIALTSIVATLGLPAIAAEGPELQLRPQGLAASASLKKVEAPFRAGRDPMPEILLTQELEARAAGPSASCETTARDLCYDLRDRRVVYRRAREYMPQIGGLKAESISVKRSGVTLKYSF